MTDKRTCEISQTAVRGNVDELAMLVRRLVQSLRKAAPDNDLADQALDYLKRYGFGGTFLRDVPPGMKPSKAPEAAGTSPSASAPENVPALRAALEAAKAAINSMKVEAETAAQGDEQMMLEACEQISTEGLAASLAIDAVLAAAPAAPVMQLDTDRVLSIADEHAVESREDGVRLIDRGGLVAFASDVLRATATAADATTLTPRAHFIKGWDAARMHLGMQGSVDSDRAMRKYMAAIPSSYVEAPVVLPEPTAAIREVMALVSDWRMKEHFSAEAQLDAHGSEATPVDEDRAKRCWIEEREAWQAIEDKLRALLSSVSAPAEDADCERCKGSREDPEGYFDQSRGPDGDTYEGPCRKCAGTGAAHQAPAADALDAVTVPVSALRNLRKGHIYMGLCPEDSQPDSRDPDCPCCKAMGIVDAAIAAQAAQKGRTA